MKQQFVRILNKAVWTSVIALTLFVWAVLPATALYSRAGLIAAGERESAWKSAKAGRSEKLTTGTPHSMTLVPGHRVFMSVAPENIHFI